MGTILSMPLSGLMSKYGFDGGWASVFYCFGEWSVRHTVDFHGSPSGDIDMPFQAYGFVNSRLTGRSNRYANRHLPYLQKH